MASYSTQHCSRPKSMPSSIGTPVDRKTQNFKKPTSFFLPSFARCSLRIRQRKQQNWHNRQGHRTDLHRQNQPQRTSGRVTSWIILTKNTRQPSNDIKKCSINTILNIICPNSKAWFEGIECIKRFELIGSEHFVNDALNRRQKSTCRRRSGNYARYRLLIHPL